MNIDKLRERDAAASRRMPIPFDSRNIEHRRLDDEGHAARARLANLSHNLLPLAEALNDPDSVARRAYVLHQLEEALQ